MPSGAQRRRSFNAARTAFKNDANGGCSNRTTGGDTFSSDVFVCKTRLVTVGQKTASVQWIKAESRSICHNNDVGQLKPVLCTRPTSRGPRNTL